MKFTYYISHHGFGHISRSLEIIRHFSEKGNETEIVTGRTDFLEKNSLNIQVRNLKTDTGVIQKNSLEINVEETLLELKKFRQGEDELIEKETLSLKKFKPDAVISDSSSLPFAAAENAGIPSFFIGNFTWDYIYANYIKYNSDFSLYSAGMRNSYAKCTKAFILPFHCPTDAFRDFIHVGVVGRSPRSGRDAVRKRLGFDSKKKYYLFSFGAYGLSGPDFLFEKLDKDSEIFISGLENFQHPKIRNIQGEYYPDLVGAADFVVTKPGYGILAETYLAGTPVIYTDRGDFAEYPHLVEAMKKTHASAYISQQDLFSFKFPEKNDFHLPSEKISGNGAEEILQEINRIL
ncbi:MAG TPA: glycosyltransferase family protein [Leptospiraceae bacterium]|nr:glycosyltransferase family protein [Leptospiraceae bacterium]HMZ58619.1 glycosyltransferase family protein [Leptospiraceae bacterium]